VHLQVAILRYEGAPEVDPPLDVAYDLADRDGLVTTEFCILLFRTVLKKGKIKRSLIIIEWTINSAMHII